MEVSIQYIVAAAEIEDLPCGSKVNVEKYVINFISKNYFKNMSSCLNH